LAKLVDAVRPAQRQNTFFIDVNPAIFNCHSAHNLEINIEGLLTDAGEILILSI
jgi:hypothetical protein